MLIKNNLAAFDTWYTRTWLDIKCNLSSYRRFCVAGERDQAVMREQNRLIAYAQCQSVTKSSTVLNND